MFFHINLKLIYAFCILRTCEISSFTPFLLPDSNLANFHHSTINYQRQIAKEGENDMPT